MADKIPEEFSKIIKDFLNDLLTTFPELSEELDENIKIIQGDELPQQIGQEKTFIY